MFYRVTLHGARLVTVAQVRDVFMSWSSSNIFVPVQLELLHLQGVCEVPQNSASSNNTKSITSCLVGVTAIVGGSVAGTLPLVFIVLIAFGVALCKLKRNRWYVKLYIRFVIRKMLLINSFNPISTENGSQLVLRPYSCKLFQ